DLDAAAVRLDGPAGNGQAQSHSPGLPRAPGVHAIESLEDPLTVGRRNSRAAIFHLDDSLARPRVLRHYADRSSARGVLDRVVQQIVEALPKKGRVAPDPDGRRGLDLQTLMLFLRENVQTLRHNRSQVTQVDQSAGKRNPPRFPTGER